MLLRKFGIYHSTRRNMPEDLNLQTQDVFGPITRILDELSTVIFYKVHYTLSAGQTVLPVTVTPRDTVHLQNGTLPQLVKTFAACHGALMFITVFTTARHMSIFQARVTKPTLSQPISSSSILTLYSHFRLGLPRRPIRSGFPTK